MSLVKSKKSLSPMRETFMSQDPFLNDFFESRGLLNLSRLFDEEIKNGFVLPRINVKDQEDAFEMELAAPGLTKDDFNITIDDGILTISSEKTQNKEEEENGYLRKEFSYNSFSRSFNLPDTIDEDKDIKATYNDGILKLVLNKKEDLKQKPPKSVKVS